MLDRTIFFNEVREQPFNGRLTQMQVDGMNYKLDVYERDYDNWDLRWVAYAFATAFLETAQTMQPIEELGKGRGKEYGKPDPKTGEIYYGRGDVQLTWADNYKYVDSEFGFTNALSLYLHPRLALDPLISAQVMYQGMKDGWFRKGHTLPRYFNATMNNAYQAREIINGDKDVKPKWGGGKTIGALIAGYHDHFLDALTKADEHVPVIPVVPPEQVREVIVRIESPEGVKVRIIVNGNET